MSNLCKCTLMEILMNNPLKHIENTHSFKRGQLVEVTTGFNDLDHIPKGTKITLTQPKIRDIWEGRGIVAGVSRNILVPTGKVRAV